MLSWLITENVEQWTLTLVLKRQDIALFSSFLIKQKSANSLRYLLQTTTLVLKTKFFSKSSPGLNAKLFVISKRWIGYPDVIFGALNVWETRRPS